MAKQQPSKDDDWDSEEAATTSATQPDQAANGLSPASLRKRTKESSFSSVVADLAVGESASRVHHLNQSMTIGEFERDLSEMKSMIANNARPSVKTAQARTGGQYRVETGETITAAGRIYLLVIVTRTA